MRTLCMLATFLVASLTMVTAPNAAEAAGYFSFSAGGPGYHVDYGYRGSYWGHPRRYKPYYYGHGARYKGYRHYYRSRYYYGPVTSYGHFRYYGGVVRHGRGYGKPLGLHGHGHRGHGGISRFRGHATGVQRHFRY